MKRYSLIRRFRQIYILEIIINRLQVIIKDYRSKIHTIKDGNDNLLTDLTKIVERKPKLTELKFEEIELNN